MLTLNFGGFAYIAICKDLLYFKGNLSDVKSVNLNLNNLGFTIDIRKEKNNLLQVVYCILSNNSSHQVLLLMVLSGEIVINPGPMK